MGVVLVWMCLLNHRASNSFTDREELICPSRGARWAVRRPSAPHARGRAAGRLAHRVPRFWPVRRLVSRGPEGPLAFRTLYGSLRGHRPARRNAAGEPGPSRWIVEPVLDVRDGRTVAASSSRVRRLLQRQETPNASPIRPTGSYRARRGLDACPCPEPVPAAASAAADDPGHAGGARRLPGRRAEVLRARTAGRDAGRELPAGEPPANQRRPAARSWPIAGCDRSSRSARLSSRRAVLAKYRQGGGPCSPTADTLWRCSPRQFASPAFGQSMSRDHRICVFLRRPRWRRHQARRPRRQADPGRQYRVALRLHAAICRAAAIVDALPAARAADRRRAVERFRRPGAGHGGRHQAHRPRRVRASAFRSPPRPR